MSSNDKNSSHNDKSGLDLASLGSSVVDGIAHGVQFGTKAGLEKGIKSLAQTLEGDTPPPVTPERLPKGRTVGVLSLAACAVSIAFAGLILFTGATDPIRTTPAPLSQASQNCATVTTTQEKHLDGTTTIVKREVSHACPSNELSTTEKVAIKAGYWAFLTLL